MDYTRGYVDLHTHLGGSTSVPTLYEIAIRRGMNIKIPSVSKKKVHISSAYHEFADLMNGKHDKDITHDEYLKKFDLVEDIQSTTYSVEKSIRDIMMNSFVNHGVDLIEIRFNPMFRNRGGFYDIDRIIESACTEMKKVSGMFPVQAGIIICTDWRFTSDKSTMLAEKAVKYKNMGVVGFDIAGPYVKTMDIREHVNAFNIASAGGLGTCAHVGEINGAYEIENLFKYITPRRIGHGITISESKELMKYAVDKNILFEVCPSSVIKTGAVSNRQEIIDIIDIFQENDVVFNLNTDGITFLNTNIRREYREVAIGLGWSMGDIMELNNRAKMYSFVV